MENSSSPIDFNGLLASSYLPRSKPVRHALLTKGAFVGLMDSVGAEHRDCDFGNYRLENPGQKKFLAKSMAYAKQIDQHWLDVRGLIFFGSAGTGKDHMMMAIAKAAFRAGYWVRWINGPTFRVRVRDAIRDDQELESAIFRELVSDDFLWLSDPVVGDQSLTPYQMEFLYRVVDHRYRNQKPMWVTANFASGKEFSGLIGSAIYDRLINKAVAMHCDWESYRKPD